MRNLKLTLEYEGTHFSGFQRQSRSRTIQGELEAALEKLFQKNIRVTASGRTDAGVHAEGQVVNCRVNSQIPLSKIQRGLNHYLPQDLAVIGIGEVSPSFHAQYTAKWKLYEYRVLCAKSRSPLERRQSYYFPFPLDMARMKRAAGMLCGKHDFRLFESSGGRRSGAVRTVRRFRVRRQGKIISFAVEANGFLYKMVRSMVGTLLEVGSGRLGLSDFKQILASKDRSLIGPTVPPQGLILKRVTYSTLKHIR